jgi:plastocyanin
MKKRIGLVAVLAVAVGSVFAGLGTAATHATKPKVVTVTATDFRFVFKPKVTYKHGVKYTFKLINKGDAAHNIDFQTVKASKIIGHGKTTKITVTFKKKGKYQFICDVPRHAELGMSGTLVVH